MNRLLRFFCKAPFTLPHLLAFALSKNRDIIKADIWRWAECAHTPYQHNVYLILSYLLCSYPEYRNLFYIRVCKWSFFLRYLPKKSDLYIYMASEQIEGGLFIQHGNSSSIAAKHIGKNCWINQHVSIGYNDSASLGLGTPVVGDNVHVSTGAIVAGPITIGDNSVIGANATVMKDVPANTTVIPSPTMVLYENGERVNHKL